MSPNARKICLVGDPGVGKTALLRRLLGADEGADFEAANDEHGIRLAACELHDGEDRHAIVLWDVAGISALDSLNQAFLSGIDGIVAVADASRPSTAATALRLVAQIRRLYPGTPAVLLLNKRDLAAPVDVPALPEADIAVFETSARGGAPVADPFNALLRRVRERDAH